ncbi:MAG: cell surface protein [Myxococcota bacterium]
MTGVAAVGCGADGNLALPYATEVVSFEPGPGAGFGQDDLPEVVLGPPIGLGVNAGGLDVLSLGVGGTIVLGFDDAIVDGPGADFVVFENPFFVGGDSEQIFAELGRVSVSADGESWQHFGCEPSGPPPWPGCAGWRPTRRFDPAVLPLDPDESGGDPFDLADVDLALVRFVRIEDLSSEGEGTTAGFDLDAVGVVHLDRPDARTSQLAELTLHHQ